MTKVTITFDHPLEHLMFINSIIDGDSRLITDITSKKKITNSDIKVLKHVASQLMGVCDNHWKIIQQIAAGILKIPLEDFEKMLNNTALKIEEYNKKMDEGDND